MTDAADNVMVQALLIGKRGLWAWVAAFLLLAATCAFAQEGWIKDQKGCKISNPSPKAAETVSWSGPCADGFAEGQGVLQWYMEGTAGVRYEGTLVHGTVSGQGKLTMPDGTRYEGGWVNGKQNGTGKYRAADGTTYEGEWKDGAPDGRGVLRRASGEVMDGTWKAGAYLGPPQQ